MRFVILQHEFPKSHDRDRHWDLMLERDGVLVTWALADAPSVGAAIDATRLSDHRLAYLQYEGQVSGDRGTVVQWDRGSYEMEEQTEQRFRLRLASEKLHNVLVQLEKLSSERDDQNWRCELSAGE